MNPLIATLLTIVGVHALYSVVLWCIVMFATESKPFGKYLRRYFHNMSKLKAWVILLFGWPVIMQQYSRWHRAEKYRVAMLPTTTPEDPTADLN